MLNIILLLLSSILHDFDVPSCVPQARHNAFTYKIRSAPPEVTAAWEALKGKNSARKEEFKSEIIAVTKKMGWQHLVAKLAVKNSAVARKGDESVAGWIPWSKMIQEHGEAQVKSMIDLQSVRYTPNPALEGGSIAFPLNLLFWVEDKKVVKKSYQEEAVTLHKEQEVDEETFSTMQAVMSASSHDNALVDSPSLQGQGVQSGSGNPNPPPPASPLVAQIKKVHGACDRQTRDFRMMLEKTQGNVLTARTPMEGLLQSEMAKSKEQDQILLECELKLSTGDETCADTATLALATCL